MTTFVDTGVWFASIVPTDPRHREVVELGRSFFDLALFAIHRIDEQDLQHGWRTFHDQPDRRWSFTDCTSKAVIERLPITRALTLDCYFAEFGVAQSCRSGVLAG